MNVKTAAALAEIKSAVASGQTMIVPSIFSHFFGRTAVSAAFRIAKRDGIIEINYMSCVNTPVYHAAGTHAAIKAAMAEKTTATVQ